MGPFLYLSIYLYVYLSFFLFILNISFYLFQGLVILKKSLDYETVSSYNLDLEAVDRAEGEDKLASRASVIIKVCVCVCVCERKRERN